MYKNFIFYFPNQKWRTTNESKKRLECYQPEELNLPREYSVFDGSQCIVNNRKFKMQRRRESQKSNSLTSKTTTLHVNQAFLYISLPSTARLTVKMPNFTFCEGRKQAMTKFILFMNLDMVYRNTATEEFACIWQGNRVGIITIETFLKKNVNSLFHSTFSWLSAVVVSFKNSP